MHRIVADQIWTDLTVITLHIFFKKVVDGNVGSFKNRDSLNNATNAGYIGRT